MQFTSHYVRRTFSLVGVLIILVALARWGGTARPGPLFVMGITVLTSLVVSFLALVVWLYHDPSFHHIKSRPVTLQSSIAILSLSSCAMFSIGFYWDEIWHRRIGGAGNDFLWAPHLLIYTSLLLFAVFAFMGIVLTLRGQGSLRERFRSEPHIGLLGLVSAFLVVAAPSDELWHRIYGKDITAWSLPHITLAGGVAFISFIAASLALSLHKPHNNWRGLRDMSLFEWIGLLLIVIGNTVFLQFGTTEWEGIKTLHPETDIFRQAFWQRPIWLYPVVVISISSFVSTFTLYSFKRFGVATLVALGVIFFRFSCLAILGAETNQLGIGYTGHLLMLIPALALDTWYFLQRDKSNTFLLIGGCITATIVFSFLGLPLIKQMLIYPVIIYETIPPMIIMSLIMCLAMSWYAIQCSSWLGTLDSRPRLNSITTRSALYISAGLVATLLLAISVTLFGTSPQ